MDYAELANQINRPYNTVRKWRNEITTLSGYEFTRIKVRNGRKRRQNRTTYDFSEKDVIKFLQLNQLLQSGVSKMDAIAQCFGNKELEQKEQQEDKFQKIIKVYQSQSNKIKHLIQCEENLQRQLAMLNQTVDDLLDRVKALENKEFMTKFKNKR
jgi:hypothetical protein